MTTQPDTATSGATTPPAVPHQPPAAGAPARSAGFAATDVLVNEFDGGPDTVQRALNTPGELQPHTDLGLKDDEYDRIRQILGRRPTASELAMYSIMWSEHCSYKSSKVHLRQFGEKAPQNTRMLAGIGENAGVVQISDDIAAITNEAGNVLGIMPHPEHAVEALTGPSLDGLGFFTSVLRHLAGATADAAVASGQGATR